MIPSVLDLNFAYNPSCAYDSSRACPLAPPESRVSVSVRAAGRAPRYSPCNGAHRGGAGERSRMPPTGTIVGGSSPATDGAYTGLDQHENMGCAILRGYVARHFRRRRRE
jgi:hypothetical protein